MIDPSIQSDLWRQEEDEQAKTQFPNDEQITITAENLYGGMPVEEIREKLLKDGLTEEQVFLCVKAAEILNKV